MPILRWSEKYTVGIPPMDTEHRNLVDMINKAYDAISILEEKQVLGELIKEMKAYAEYHFSTEEALMREFKYPDNRHHMDEHDAFAIKAARTDTMLRQGKDINLREILRFLGAWLGRHILLEDRKLAVYLAEQGYSGQPTDSRPDTP